MNLEPKAWYTSRTIMTNLLVVVVTAAIAVVEVFLQAGTAVTVTTVLLGVLAGLNVVLRSVTSVPIAGTAAARQLEATRALEGPTHV